MRYKDDLEKGWVNGYFVGLRQGTNTQDEEEEPESDGYEPQRDAVRFGTVTQDAEETDFPEPMEYKVTYLPGDDSATGEAPTETDKAEGEVFEAAANAFTLDGHTFTGWLGSDGMEYQPTDEVRMPGGDFTLTAQWEVNGDG